jgi:pilus assembly protein Flp/PilA
VEGDALTAALHPASSSQKTRTLFAGAQFNTCLNNGLHSREDHYLNPRRTLVHTLFTYLRDDESGVTAIEYALIAALIAIAAIGAFTLLGTSLSTEFSNIAGSI